MVLKWDVLPKNSKSSDLEFFYPLRKQWHIINDSVAIVVSHQSVRTVYHHALACIKNTFAMMIYKTSFWWYAIPTELMRYNALYVLKWCDPKIKRSNFKIWYNGFTTKTLTKKEDTSHEHFNTRSKKKARDS